VATPDELPAPGTDGGTAGGAAAPAAGSPRFARAAPAAGTAGQAGIRGREGGPGLPRPEGCVVTAANRLAVRALERFVLAPAAGWNPLLIYGPAGSGKTQLARHALAALRAAGEVRDPLILSGPAMTADVTRAARGGTLVQLREDWSQRDLLALDECHRLRGQRRTQAEAAALIAAVLHRGGRVLLLSRHAPQAIHHLDPRLLSYLLSGMVVGVGAPDTADRAAVLAAAVTTLPAPVRDGVVEALASRCPGTLSDAVRVLHRAAADAAAEGAPLDLTRLDRRLVAPTPAEASMESILATVSGSSGVASERIRSAEKSRDVVAARHLCVYLATRSLGLSARAVCRALRLASPSVVAYARAAVEKRRAADGAYDQHVHALQARLEGAQRDFAW